MNPNVANNLFARLNSSQKGIPVGNAYALLADDATFGGLGPFKKIYVDAVNGSDTNSGLSPTAAVQSLAGAYALVTAGKNHTIVIIGDGSTAASVRLSTAFTFAKAATNIVGISAPSLFSPRARIATVAAATAVPNFFTISSDGGIFTNLDFYHGYTSDGSNQICLTLTGKRNVFSRCHFGGITKGDDAGARVLKLSGAEENLFEDCVIGLDTVTRSVANANLEFASGSARNVFRRCVFPTYHSSTGGLAIIGSAASCIDRFNIFEDCIFYNGGAGQQVALATLAASAGGFLLFKNCTIANKITGYGTDATTRAQIWTTNPANSATTVIAVAPSA